MEIFNETQVLEILKDFVKEVVTPTEYIGNLVCNTSDTKLEEWLTEAIVNKNYHAGKENRIDLDVQPDYSDRITNQFK